MKTERRRAVVNTAGDGLVVVGLALVLWGIWFWSIPLALVVAGIGLIAVGYLAALK
jgi:hypothetical protein